MKALRFILWFILLSILRISSMAQISKNTVSFTEAESIAKKMLNKNVKSVNVDNIGSLQITAREKTDDPAYYIFNSSDASGFVIISGEKGTEQVLAYSNEGAFDASKVGYGADAFLNAYDSYIAQIRNGEVVARTNHHKSVRVVPKLLPTAPWDQTGVYFNKTYAPVVNSKSCYAGCCPTAMAILMRYWSHPLCGRNQYSYTTKTYKKNMSCDFSKENFDWSLMKDHPTYGSKESDAISRLMLDCGIAMEADYGPNFTYGYLGSLARALKDYFDYTNAKYVLRDMDGIDDWQEMIINEINNDRPCIVAALGARTDDHHAFIVDGVDANGIFHYNLGWGGYNNGYYKDSWIGSNMYATTELLIGIEPVYDYQPSSQLSFSRIRILDPGPFLNEDKEEELSKIEKGEPFIMYFHNLWNLGPTAFKGRNIHIELRDKDGKMKDVVSGDEDFVDLQSNYYYDWAFVTCWINPEVTLEEEDCLWLYAQDENGEFLPVLVVDKQNSTIALKDYMTELTPVKSVFTEHPAQSDSYDLQGRKKGNWEKGIFIQNGKKMLVK